MVDKILLSDYLCCRLSEQKNVKWDVLGMDGCPNSPDELLEGLAHRRGLLRVGGAPDYERAANAFLKEYRDGRLGRFTFDAVPQE